MFKIRFSRFVWLLALCLLMFTAGFEACGQTNVMTLKDCEAYASANSLGLWRQQLRNDSSRRQRWIAWEIFLAPRLSAQSNRSRLINPILESEDAIKPDPVKSSTFGATHTLPLGFKLGVSATATDIGTNDTVRWQAEVSKKVLGEGSWLGSMSSVWSSELGAKIATNNLELYHRNLTRDVRMRYHDTIRARQTLVSHRLRLEQARRNLQLAIAREEPLDMATAQVEVPQAEAAVLRGERAVLTALDQLKETMGMPLEEPLDVVDDLDFEAVAIYVNDDLEWCLQNHEDIRNQQLKIKILRHELRRLLEAQWPDVTVALRHSRPVTNGLEGDEEEVVSIRAEWALGGVAERSRVAIQKNSILDAQIELRQIIISLQRNVTDLARRLDEARRQVDVGQARLQLAHTRARLYQDRWDNGEIDIIEYIRSQNEAEDSRVNLINEQISYLDLLATYRAIIGRE